MTHIKITNDVRARLAWLETEGRLTPAAIVEDGKQADSPLHKLFDWDRDKAAYQHWLWQARVIIHSVRLVTTTTEKVTIQAPFYVRDPALSTKTQGYVSVIQLQKEPDQARESLRLEFGRAESALTRARSLAAALNMEDEVESLILRLTGLREQLEPQHAKAS